MSACSAWQANITPSRSTSSTRLHSSALIPADGTRPSTPAQFTAYASGPRSLTRATAALTAALVAHVDADVVRRHPGGAAHVVEGAVVGVGLVQAEHSDALGRDGRHDGEPDAAGATGDDGGTACGEVLHGSSSVTWRCTSQRRWSAGCRGRRPACREPRPASINSPGDRHQAAPRGPRPRPRQPARPGVRTRVSSTPSGRPTSVAAAPSPPTSGCAPSRSRWARTSPGRRARRSRPCWRAPRRSRPR